MRALSRFKDGPLFPALLSPNMLLGTSEGQSSSEAQIMAMFAEVGVEEIQRLPFKVPNHSRITLTLQKSRMSEILGVRG
jgi:hypothetical protein